MPRAAGRRFGVLDLLILVAATAVGLGMLQAMSPEIQQYAAPVSPIGPIA